MKNPIRNVLSKPILWYLRIKNFNKINVIINTDGVSFKERDFKKEKEAKERMERIKERITEKEK